MSRGGSRGGEGGDVVSTPTFQTAVSKSVLRKHSSAVKGRRGEGRGEGRGGEGRGGYLCIPQYARTYTHNADTSGEWNDSLRDYLR